MAEEDSARFSLLNGNSLLIKDVESIDSGNYTCSASNHITDEIKVSGSVKLESYALIWNLWWCWSSGKQ